MKLLPDAYAVSSKAYDLRRDDHIQALFKHVGKVDTLYHLAATVGGIGANRLHPGTFFYDNMKMGLNLIHAAMIHNVGKVVMVGTTCSYPKFTPVPFLERCLFDGYPEETNAPYGIAKRALYAMLKAYQDEYNLRFAFIIPTNLYGPGDNFGENTSHVIPALIRKCLSNQDEIEVWGTGTVTRDFLYVEDAARAIKLAGDVYDRPEPLNVGTGHEVRIDTVLHFIVQITEFCGKIRYDKTKLDGQPRRALNIDNARDVLGWQPETKLQDGLRKTIEWYKAKSTN
jgi:nucleoside-diphosphate-sugar epimerase